jgi:hypothetical protein
MKPTDEELEAMAAKYDHTADDPMLDGVSAIKRDLLIKRDLQTAALLRACKGLVRLNEATQARAEAAEAERDQWRKTYHDTHELFAQSDEKRMAAQAKLKEAVEVMLYADRMVKLDLQHMTDWGSEHFHQAVYDTGNRIRAFLACHQKEPRTYEDGLEDAAKVAEHAHLKRVEGTVGGVIVQTRVYIAAAIRAMKGNSDD